MMTVRVIDMKKVLLVGDSIRLSYNNAVAELLSGKAAVWGPEENCSFAKYTLWHIGTWLSMGGTGTPDIIHWNNGIWDTFKVRDIEPFTTLDDYMRDMKLIYNEMKKTDAQIIFATTTPVGKHFLSDKNDRIDAYNDAIASFMRSEGVPVNDLNAVVKASPECFLGSDLLHLSDEGVRVVSSKVAGCIENYL